MGVIILVDVINTGSFLPPLTSWVSPRGLKGWLYADRLVARQDLDLVARPSSCRNGPAITNRQILSRDIRLDEQVTGIGGGGAYQARPCRLAAGQAGIGAQRGRPRLVWGGRRASKWPHCCDAPGPTVLGGPPQAKAPPAHSLTLCVCGVEMSLLCPPGAPTGAHRLIYQANPIGRPARKATADFSKIKILFLGSPCTIFPKVSQTANKSASVVLKHHPVFPPRSFCLFCP